MGITIEITNVNKEANFISFSQDGESKTAEVVSPAQIKWAKVGKAEAGFNPEGKITFLKSLEPKQTNNSFNGGYPKKESNIMAISTMEVLENATLNEIKAVYDSLNVRGGNKNCKASTLFRREDGKYDVVFYTTTFVPKDLEQGPEM